jgi:hypothetical protein
MKDDEDVEIELSDMEDESEKFSAGILKDTVLVFLRGHLCRIYR